MSNYAKIALTLNAIPDINELLIIEAIFDSIPETVNIQEISKHSRTASGQYKVDESTIHDVAVNLRNAIHADYVQGRPIVVYYGQNDVTIEAISYGVQFNVLILPDRIVPVVTNEVLPSFILDRVDVLIDTVQPYLCFNKIILDQANKGTPPYKIGFYENSQIFNNVTEANLKISYGRTVGFVNNGYYFKVWDANLNRIEHYVCGLQMAILNDNFKIDYDFSVFDKVSVTFTIQLQQCSSIDQHIIVNALFSDGSVLADLDIYEDPAGAEVIYTTVYFDIADLVMIITDNYGNDIIKRKRHYDKHTFRGQYRC